jgi:hypothetical protein
MGLLQVSIIVLESAADGREGHIVAIRRAKMAVVEFLVKMLNPESFQAAVEQSAADLEVELIGAAAIHEQQVERAQGVGVGLYSVQRIVGFPPGPDFLQDLAGDEIDGKVETEAGGGIR